MSEKRTGWRVWGLTEDERGPVLRSPEFGSELAKHNVHPTGLIYGERESWASCLEEDHRPPKKHCRCGLYSADSEDAAYVWLPPGTGAVVGEVELLGKILEGSNDDRQFPHRRLHAHHQRGDRSRHVAGVQICRRPARRRAARPPGARGTHRRADGSIRRALPGGPRAGGCPPGRAGRHLPGCLALRAWSQPDESAGLVLFNRERTHVVLQLRSAYVDEPGTWAFIGGAVEHGEGPTDAALREAWEEAGIQLLPRARMGGRAEGLHVRVRHDRLDAGPGLRHPRLRQPGGGRGGLDARRRPRPPGGVPEDPASPAPAEGMAQGPGPAVGMSLTTKLIPGLHVGGSWRANPPTRAGTPSSPCASPTRSSGRPRRASTSSSACGTPSGSTPSRGGAPGGVVASVSRGTRPGPLRDGLNRSALVAVLAAHDLTGDDPAELIARLRERRSRTSSTTTCSSDTCLTSRDSRVALKPDKARELL